MTLRCWSLVSRPWHHQRNPNISNYPFLSFDIETNSMRKCLLKLFSLLQKEFQPQSLKYPNRRGANWSFQVSACLSPWTWTTVESQHFGVCLWWVLTIKYNWWQYDTIQNPKRNFFPATMRAMHRMGKTWRGVFSDNSSKNRGEQLCIVHRCSFQVIKASFIYLTNYTS